MWEWVQQCIKTLLHQLKRILLDMSPPEWIFQAVWIKIAYIHLFKTNCKENFVPICNPEIFAFHILGVKSCFHS